MGVDPVKFGMEVFLARPSGSFTAAEMVGNDIKMFEPAGKKLLIGQYETVDKSRALGMIDEIREAMRAYAAEKGADGIVLCITDIMEEGSQVLLEGETEAAQKGLGIADEHDGVVDAGRPFPQEAGRCSHHGRLLGFVDLTPTTGSRKPRAPVVFCAWSRIVSWAGVPVPLSK